MLVTLPQATPALQLIRCIITVIKFHEVSQSSLKRSLSNVTYNNSQPQGNFRIILTCGEMLPV